MGTHQREAREELIYRIVELSVVEESRSESLLQRVLGALLATQANVDSSKLQGFSQRTEFMLTAIQKAKTLDTDGFIEFTEAAATGQRRADILDAMLAAAFAALDKSDYKERASAKVDELQKHLASRT